MRWYRFLMKNLLTPRTSTADCTSCSWLRQQREERRQEARRLRVALDAARHENRVFREAMATNREALDQALKRTPLPHYQEPPDDE